MQIIGCQLDIIWEDKPANHQTVYQLLEQTSLTPKALVVLPEMFATGFNMKVDRVDEGEDRPTERFLAQLARDFDIYIQGGVVNRGTDGRGLNQSITFAPDGTELARYTKIYPFSFTQEDHYYTRGAFPVTFSWQEITVAPSICYDLRFPEIFRISARQGAQLYTVIANWPQSREAHWITLLQARAIENQAYVLGVNRCGNDPGLFYSGRSLIIDPHGKIIADAGSEEGTLSARIDLQELSTYRQEFPALADIRPEFMASDKG